MVASLFPGFFFANFFHLGVSSASSWAGGTQGPAPWTAEDVERRASVRGPGKLVADAERLVARAEDGAQ